jgi:hypothetical protein
MFGAVPRRLLAFGLWLGVLAPPVHAADDAEVPSDPVFTVHRVDGTTVSGQLRQLGPDDRLTVAPAEGPPRTLPLAGVVKLTRDGPPALYTPEGSVVLLPDGDRLFRAVVGVTRDMAIEVQQYIVGNLSLPLDALVGVVLAVPTGEQDAADAVLDRMRNEPRTSEVLWLANGDRLPGSFLGLDETKVRFQTENGTLALNQADVGAIGFDPALISYPKPEGTFLELTLSDGSRLGVQHGRIDRGHVVGETRFGAGVRVPLAELLAAHVRSNRLAYWRNARLPANARSRMLDPRGITPATGRWTATCSGSPARCSTAGSARRAAAFWRIGCSRGTSASRRSWGWMTGPDRWETWSSASSWTARSALPRRRCPCGTHRAPWISTSRGRACWCS